MVPSVPTMNRVFLLLGLKNMDLHYILAPAVILQSCFSLVPSPEQLMLSQPDLISKTDCDLAVGEKKKAKLIKSHHLLRCHGDIPPQ